MYKAVRDEALNNTCITKCITAPFSKNGSTFRVTKVEKINF